jgi:transposase InsO family protein
MPGSRITDQQYELYMKLRGSGRTQVIASAKAGFSERTGRRLERYGKSPSERRREASSTVKREDAFTGIWEEEIVPLLEKNPNLSATTMLDYLQEKYPERFNRSKTRTMQRRFRQWRSQYGAEKEVMFRQEHPIGVVGLSDFTTLKGVKVTIQGEEFKHLLYHFRLAYSGWSFVKVIVGGETFLALSDGLQEALSELKGCPKEHRTDSLSACYRNREKEEDTTTRYDALCRHYGMVATRNNPGKAHENGSIESPHGHIKRALKQRLMLRGSCDFASPEAYVVFVRETLHHYNKRYHLKLTEERAHLQPLPKWKLFCVAEQNVRVSTMSTIQIAQATYSVPSRLIGYRLKVRMDQEKLECFFGNDLVLTLKRQAKGERLMDYRHVIGSLRKKPQAFRGCIYRDALFPSETYRQIWNYLTIRCKVKQACKIMVELLYFAAKYGCEYALGEEALQELEKGKVPCLGYLERKYGNHLPRVSSLPFIQIPSADLASYNQLLTA